jgi:hypothetical protein
MLRPTVADVDIINVGVIGVGIVDAGIVGVVDDFNGRCDELPKKFLKRKVQQKKTGKREMEDLPLMRWG